MSKSADLVRRRNALHQGLMGTLDESQTQIGLRLWDSSFAEQKPAAIIEFVARLAGQLALTPKLRHEVRMGIYQALLKYDAGREPIPEVNGTPPAHAVSTMAPVAQSVEPTRVSGAPPFVVFCALLEHLSDALRPYEALARHDLIGALQKHTGRSGLDSGLHRALVQWIKEGASLDAFSQAPENALASAVHMLYVAFCEAIGPVAADQILARAVRVADTVPEAARFAPRRLL